MQKSSQNKIGLSEYLRVVQFLTFLQVEHKVLYLIFFGMYNIKTKTIPTFG